MRNIAIILFGLLLSGTAYATDKTLSCVWIDGSYVSPAVAATLTDISPRAVLGKIGIYNVIVYLTPNRSWDGVIVSLGKSNGKSMDSAASMRNIGDQISLATNLNNQMIQVICTLVK